MFRAQAGWRGAREVCSWLAFLGSLLFASVPAANAQTIAAGYYHACAIATGGAVKCWGWNELGSVGDGTTVDRSSPVAVTGLSSGVTALAAGYAHSCAVTAAGGVKCWGNNYYGQLGDGTTNLSTVPVDVVELASGVVAVAAGNGHTCALTSIGGVKCWGQNWLGHLGDGSGSQQLTPVAATGLGSGVTAISAGQEHTCAVAAGGDLKCWGRNFEGQIGNGGSNPVYEPVDVTGLTSGVISVGAGIDHTCAIAGSGGAMCWGGNSNGQLGNGTSNASSTPVGVFGIVSGATRARAGSYDSCALNSAGAVTCWGTGYYGGTTPTSVPDLASGVNELSVGGQVSCARLGNAVKCWGSNTYGGLGNGTTSSGNGPVVDVIGFGATALSNQTITFGALAAKTYGAAPFAVSATATSGLTVAFTSSTPVVCTLSGSTVMLAGAGTCTVLANQAGNGSYNAAPQVAQSFAVAKAAQTITFPALGAKSVGDAAFIVSATSSSALAVAITSTTTAVCTVSGTSVTVIGVGTCTLAANQAGTANYNAATQVTQSFAVAKGNQTITFASLPGRNVGDAPFTVVATASSALAVAVTSSTATICTVSGTTVTIVAIGTCTLAANQAGSANYNAAAQVSQSFAVAAAKTAQTITFAALAAKTFGDAAFTPAASASSGLSVVLTSSTSAVCTVAGSTVTILAVGTCALAANQPGNATFGAAPQVTQSFAVAKAAQTITFAALVGRNLGDAPFTLTATASSGLAVAYASTTTAICTVAGSSVTLVATGTCSISANQAGNTNYNAAPQLAQSFVVAAAKTAQSITFGALAGKTFGDAAFTVSATASSGLVVSLSSSTTGICSVAGLVVTIVGAGTCTLAANQAGNATYAVAPQVTQSFVVAKGAQTVTFAALVGRNVGDAPFAVGATASSALAVAFTSTTTGVCTVAGSTVTIVAVGTCTLAANQAGNANFNAAPQVLQSFAVAAAKTAQTITFGALAGRNVGDAAFGLTATASSGLAVTFTSTAPTICTVSGNNVSVLAVGTCAIAANQAGNATYSAAPQVSQSFAVATAKTAQTITFAALAGKSYGAVPFGVSATASSALAVGFTSTTPAICTVSGATVTLVAVGTCTVAANQPGNATFAAAPQVAQSFAVSKAAQTISFGALPGRNVGDAAFAVSATASSGLAVSFGSATSSVCTISGTTVSIVGVGTCTIAADQAGNANVNAATQVTQSFAVAAAKATQTIAFGALSGKTLGAAAFTVSATASSSLAVTLTSTTTGVCTVAGPAVTLVAVGTCTLAANQAGNASYAAAPQVTQSFAVAKGAQTIVFPTIGEKMFGAAPFAVSATSSAGLSVAFTSNTPAVCTVSGSTVTVVAAGICSLSASQAGNANYNAATALIQSVAFSRATQAISGLVLGPASVNASQLLVASGGGSGNPVTYVSNTVNLGAGDCTISGAALLRYNSAGTCSITANQAGSANYFAAPAVTASVTVGKANQTLTFPTLASKVFGAAPFTMANAATASSGLSGIVYTSVTPSVCSVSVASSSTASDVTLISLGTCTIAANLAGTIAYNPAPQVTQSFAVTAGAQSPQVIAGFSPASPVAYVAGGTFALLATGGGSGNSVTFASPTSGVCTVSGSTASMVGPGICTLTANQIGNASYAAAQQATVNVVIDAPGSGAPTLISQTFPKATRGQAYSANVSLGGASSFSSADVTGLPPGLMATDLGGGTLRLSGKALTGGTFTPSVVGTNASGSSTLSASMVVDNFATNVGSLSGGKGHTCAVLDGGVRCWGDNTSGQLGNNSTVRSGIPVFALPAGSGATVVAAGANHTCALVADGVQCWGMGGLLGNGSAAQSLVPVIAIPVGGGATSVSSGTSTSCAVVGGGVKCWGGGPLGNNTSSSSSSPVTVFPSGSGATAVSAGASHVCAVINAGVQCWGTNSFGALGNNSTAASLTPVIAIPAGSGATAVSSGGPTWGNGDFTCAVVNGTVKCWGYGGHGQLGYNASWAETNPGYAPHATFVTGTVTAIATGAEHACAVADAGLQCWGLDSTGQLGDGQSVTFRAALIFQAIAPGSGVTDVTAGANHVCVLINGGVQCWGDNSTLQLSVDIPTNSLTPATIMPMGSGVTTISAGREISCASARGGMQCWGTNTRSEFSGSCALYQIIYTPTPLIADGSGVTSSAAGGWQACAVGAGGVQCMGDTSSVFAVRIAQNSKATAAAPGAGHACSVVDGGVQCWGANARGQLGNLSTTASTTPVIAIPAGRNSTSVAVGGSHSCAVSAGVASCWGNNDSGQLGNGGTSQSTAPGSAIGSTSAVTSIAAGLSHSCMVDAGGVRCWGANQFGQLGNGSTTASLLPVQAIPYASNATAVATGDNYTCAVVNGGVKCWGENSGGQLGNNSTVSSSVPVQAIPSGSNVIAIAAAGSGVDAHTCALANGGVMCWGSMAKGAGGDPMTDGLPKTYAKLSPLAAPAAPTVTNPVAGPGSATLSITPPADNGGAPVTGYTATCTAPGRPTATASVGPAATSVTVTGLIGGVAYACSVSAINSSGVSAPSSSAPVTPASSPRSISLNSPVDYASFVAPANIVIAANAVPGAGATVSKVEFYQGASLLGTITVAPFTYTWANSTPGNYVVTAKMTDSLSGVATSAAVNVLVASAGEVITYIHNDLAGSPIAATNVNGGVVWRESYQPYGGQIRKEAASAGNRQFFAGKPYDVDSGLSYFGARYYDPVIGRFMGPDAVDFSDKNIHTFNRFAYGNNNPYRFFDPDGNSAVDLLFLAWDVSKLGIAVYSGVGVTAAVIDVGLSVVGVISPVPGAGQYLKSIRAAEHAVEGIYTGSKLARKMEEAGNGVAKGVEEAHHIVAQKAASALPSRNILKDHGIDIHSAENGARMLKDSHRGTHTEKYYTELNSALSSANTGPNAKSQVIDVLNRYRTNLEGK